MPCKPDFRLNCGRGKTGAQLIGRRYVYDVGTGGVPVCPLSLSCIEKDGGLC